MMRRIRLQNILSFGPNGMELEMEPLTVLIGPNGSGKSNFIDVMGLLKALPTDLGAVLRERGSGDWAWQGGSRSTNIGAPKGQRANTEVREELPQATTISVGLKGYVKPFAINSAGPHLSYLLRMISWQGGMYVAGEQIDAEGSETAFIARDIHEVALRDKTSAAVKVNIKEYSVTNQESILTAIKDMRRYPEVTHIGESLKNIHLYRNWVFGRQSPIRLPQKNDLRNNVLHEDGGNLGLVLNRLVKNYDVKQRLVGLLRDLYDGLLDLHIDVEYGSVQVFLQENNATVPATRLSDGTLRYLYLLALLCDPSPPALVCLEEPELGLHPDILPGMARLLREASERCQLIVTTHSDVIVDALTETPESIVVCEKHEGQTTMRRLRRDDLDHWLDRYRLGELWRSGDLGGNRW